MIEIKIVTHDYNYISIRVEGSIEKWNKQITAQLISDSKWLFLGNHIVDPGSIKTIELVEVL